METKRMDILERVLNVLDPEEVSDERIQAFHDALVWYKEWNKEWNKKLEAESVAETVERGV